MHFVNFCADLTLSFDNVLAVVAASKGNFHIMVIGLLLSVFLIATLASFFADFIKKHQWLGYMDRRLTRKKA